MGYMDIKSYERRIMATESAAAQQLKTHDYDGLLVTVARLIELRGGLDEAWYQIERAERGEGDE
jgi:hypothetical protein